jgi:hypothetical protein
LFGLLGLLLLGCGKEELDSLPAKSNPNLQLFGFTLVDVGWDDPSDGDGKTNYLDEVAPFSNLADVLTFDHTQPIVARLEAMNAQGVKPVVHVSELFFEMKGLGGDRNGVLYGLRSDYQARWDTFVAVNGLAARPDLLGCLYIGEEPAWCSIPEAEFTAACDYAKSTLPTVPLFMVEAFSAMEVAYVPASIDWVGFDHYFLPKPSASADFQRELQLLKSKMQPHHRILLILDSHWIKNLHGSAGMSRYEMDAVARDYYEVANSDTSIIGLLGYFLPSGFDSRHSLGARGMPDHVKEEYERLGKAITGK